MIYVYLNGHDFKYEVNALLKLFYFNEEINFIDEKALVDNQSLFIENILGIKNNNYYIETKIVKNNECISQTLINNIDLIDIKVNDTKKIIKTGIKTSIFDALTKITNVKVPWGILTGIRPTKIVHDLIFKGYDKNEIKNVLLNQYKLNSEKANLIIDIAEVEKDIIFPIDENKFSLYVSIPFCPTRCLYCSFPSNSTDKYGKLIDAYTEKLLYEIEGLSKIIKNKTINTVYIGGGTPTAIPPKNLDKIINKIYECFGEKYIKEFTVEAGRPDTVNREMLNMLKSNNIKRISINPQTMNDSTLRLIGRDHKTEEIITSYNLAKDIGFEVINMDLIVGLPGEGLKEIEYTMREIEKLKPENLTVHTMAIKRASKLKESIDNYSLGQQAIIEEMLNITKYYAKKMGMIPYYMYRQKQILGNFENVGYTTPQNECIYNILIMEEKQSIMAVGAGGTSKIYFPKEDRLERVPNVKSLEEYIKRVDEMIERKSKYI
ncbi:oxygen-independent coproporphyrinogen-III oxidase-like protein HemZ [Gottschalkia purinilytica]|uniref:Oxygen-independent coproporphyrinogen-III oxidase-like protein HemZ n=1 Tax=Gottschalkia purinilytica TaxID=1503 RepID=A0A0L0WB30_GOTPU|nr:coproporphyrinogen dehydrogenase HemZ [Gottschalkia purinilytica]KNF08703.1 oxygen-independent coproporphyrinogen-III oxidase-like protein HemZ [Gottschalkia purinilytica]